MGKCEPSAATLRVMAAPKPTRRLELRHWRAGASVVAGADEVGRGPWAGPLVVGAVVLPRERREWLPLLRDSKALTDEARRALAPRIRDEAEDAALGWVSSAEIDELGLAAALRLGYRRAILGLSRAPDIVLADGSDRLRLPWPTEMVVRGDARVASIAAASIIAKVARDDYMVALDAQFPEFGFARHKGYGAPEHRAALARCAPCPEHRRSFRPVAQAIQFSAGPAPLAAVD